MAGLYSICYVNGFQTQPDEAGEWLDERADLVVHAQGSPVVDPGWPDEYVLDTSTEQKRAAILAVVEPWIARCASDGFAAVEIDNLDSHLRSKGVLDASDNLAMAALYVEVAHRHGLAIGQKNAADMVESVHALGFDFAITESCVEFDECAAFTSVYPTVLDVEYTDELGVGGYRKACREGRLPALSVLRDHDLVAAGEPGHHAEWCEK